MTRSSLVAALVAALCALALSASAQANTTISGNNGKIAYTTDAFTGVDGIGLSLIKPTTRGDGVKCATFPFPTGGFSAFEVFGISLPFNVLDCKIPAERPLVASGIVSAFKKLYGDSWGPRLEHILRNALLTLLEIPEAGWSEGHGLEDNVRKIHAKAISDQFPDERACISMMRRARARTTLITEVSS